MDIKKIYVVFGENFNAKIFKKLITVEKYMKQNENLQFKGFFSEELATQWLRDYNLKQSEQLIKIKEQEQITQDKTEKVIKAIPAEEIQFSKHKIFSYFKDNSSIYSKQKLINTNDHYNLFFDGASKGNPGLSSIGYAIFDNESQVIYKNALNIGIKTNNEAEYIALLYGLNSALNLGIKNINCYGDSLLIINQMLRKYQVKSQILMPLNLCVNDMTKCFVKTSFEHILRSQNAYADKLANSVLQKIDNTFRN